MRVFFHNVNRFVKNVIEIQTNLVKCVSIKTKSVSGLSQTIGCVRLATHWLCCISAMHGFT